MDWLEASLFFMLGVLVALLFTVAVTDPGIREIGASAVCDSHGLELDDFEYKGSGQGYSVIRCWAENPSSSVFRNVGGE